LPDIDFPLAYDPESIGESTLDSPLPWDKIQPTSYRVKSNVSALKKELVDLHNARVETDPEFIYMRDAAAYRQVRSKQTSLSLNMAQRQQEKADSEAFWLDLENAKRKRQALPLIASLDELNPKPAADLASAESASAPVSGPTGAAILDSPDAALSIAVPAQLDINDEAPANDSVPHVKADSAPDPQLVESGNILLDMISLEKRLAAEPQKQQAI